jgi:hypothetical protein
MLRSMSKKSKYPIFQLTGQEKTFTVEKFFISPRVSMYPPTGLLMVIVHLVGDTTQVLKVIPLQVFYTETLEDMLFNIY